MNKLLAECFGTFVLVFAGTGAIIVNDVSGGTITHLGVGLTFGLAVMIMIYALGDESGAHLNPAVSLGFWLANRLPRREVAPYILSQITGGVLASLFLKMIFPLHATSGTTNLKHVSTMSGFAVEFFLTLILMFVIIHVSEGSKEKGLMAGIAVGGTVAMEAIWAGPITGASMNPARSLAPALVSGQWDNLWIYLTAPFLGSISAIFLCCLIRRENCCRTQS